MTLALGVWPTFRIPATVSAGTPQDTCVAVPGVVVESLVTINRWQGVAPSMTVFSAAVALIPVPVSTTDCSTETSAGA